MFVEDSPAGEDGSRSVRRLFTWRPSSSSSSSCIALILLWRSLLNNWGWCGFLLDLLLDGNEETNDLLALDHVVLINLELAEDIVDLSLGHLVSPGHEGVLEHLGVNLAVLVVGLESL